MQEDLNKSLVCIVPIVNKICLNYIFIVHMPEYCTIRPAGLVNHLPIVYMPEYSIL